MHPLGVYLQPTHCVSALASVLVHLNKNKNYVKNLLIGIRSTSNAPVELEILPLVVVDALQQSKLDLNSGMTKVSHVSFEYFFSLP